jgi:hypothetical protein
MAIGTNLCMILMTGYHALMDGQEPAQPSVERLIANFMSGSATLGTYLHHDGPLTTLQKDLLAQTITGLQTFLVDWQDRNRTTS